MHTVHGPGLCDVRDIFPEGLRVLDLLEITGSTATTAQWVNCDQSSVSRSYRRVNRELTLGFCKDDGRYRAQHNLPLLRCLREAAQIHRLNQGSQRLQWITHVELPLQQLQASQLAPLPPCWSSEAHTLMLLQQRVLDLAVIGSEPTSGLRVLVLPELNEQPPIQSLLRQISAAARLEPQLQLLTLC